MPTSEAPTTEAISVTATLTGACGLEPGVGAADARPGGRCNSHDDGNRAGKNSPMSAVPHAELP